MKTTAKTTKTPARTAAKETTMKTKSALPTIASVQTLTGDDLLAAYERVLGESPKPRTPVPTMRKRIIAALEKPATAPAVEEALEEFAAAAPTEAPVAGPDPDKWAVAAGIQSAWAHAIAEVDEADPVTAAEPSNAPVDALDTEPAADAPAADTSPAEANTDAADADDSDPRDMILARARTLEKAAQRAFFESFEKRDLFFLLERITGERPGGRTSLATAVERLLASLAPAAPMAAEPALTPAATPAPPSTSTRGPAADLPPVGTVLTKLDRHGAERCRCEIVAGGVDYAGTIYKSLSAAAIAASRDLGNATKQTSGPKFWGLLPSTPRAPKPAKGLDLEVLARAFDKYRERAQAAVSTAAGDDRPRLQQLLKDHATALVDLTAHAVA